MTKTLLGALGVAAMVAVSAVACGGGGGSSAPTTPTPSTPSTPTTGTPSETATITIGSNGTVSPSSVTITRGGRVTIVNNDSRAHDMSSDPHPEHTQCVEINQIGFLTAGQQRTSGNFNTARSCGFHDHNLPNDAGLKGTIIIQ